jgi:hypothetical protein
MVELRCNTCPNLANDFCTKMKVVLPNGQAKLYYGGAVGTYHGSIKYPSKCGVKEEAKTQQRLGVIILNLDKEIVEH